MMSKKAAAGVGVAVVLLIALVACIFATPWDNMKDDNNYNVIPYNGMDGKDASAIFPQDADGNYITDAEHIDKNSLNYKVFEEYGPLLVVLAALMFGAMVGGICIAREEDESNDSD